MTSPACSGFSHWPVRAHLLHGAGHELVVVFDGEYAIDTRAATDADYKANRAHVDHTPIKSLRPVKAALDVAGVAWIELDTHEGDDVIATFTHAAVACGRVTTCYSGDRDLYQLLDHPDVTILTPNRSIVTGVDVHRRYGVLAQQWPSTRRSPATPPTTSPASEASAPRPPQPCSQTGGTWTICADRHDYARHAAAPSQASGSSFSGGENLSAWTREPPYQRQRSPAVQLRPCQPPPSSLSTSTLW